MSERTKGRAVGLSFRVADLLVPVALVVACLVFFRHVLWGDYYFPWDFVESMYPTQRLVSDAIRQGDFPLWTPYVLGGYPLVGDPQASLFYPPLLLFHLWPHSASLTLRTLEWLTVLHVALAGVGMYWLGRSLGLSPVGGSLAGLTFMLAGFFPVHAEHETWILAAAWLPVWLGLCVRLLAAPRAWHIPAIALVTALSFLAGHTQTSLFSLYLVGFYAVWHCWGRVRRGQTRLALRDAGVLGLALALGLTLAAVQLLPSLELTGESFRRTVVFPDEYGVLDLAAPLTMLMPKILGSDGSGPYLGNEVTQTQKYLGLAPLVFLVVSLFARPRHPATRFFGGMTLVTLLGSFGARFLVYQVLRWLPFVTLFRRPAALFPLALLGIAVLGGMLLDGLVVAKPPLPRWTRGAAVGGAAVLAVFYSVITLYPPLWSAALSPLSRLQVVQRVSGPETWPTVQRQGLELAVLAAGVALVLAGLWLWPRARYALAALLVLLTYADLSAAQAGQIYNASAGDPGQLYSATRIAGQELPDLRPVYDQGLGHGQLASAEVGSLFLMASAVLRVEAVNGYNPLQLRRLTEYYGNLPSANSRAFDLLNVRYLLTPTVFRDESGLPSPFWRFGQWWGHERRYLAPQALDPGKFKRVSASSGDALTLWENRAVLPRFFAAERYQVVPSAAERLALLRNPQFDPGQTLLLEEPPPLDPTGRLAGPADIVRYTNTEVEGAVQVVDGATLLFIGIPYYPGWRASVDGAPTPLLIAQHAFMALPLPPGAHTVRLSFQPSSFTWGAWLTLFGVAVLASSPLWFKPLLHY